MSGLLVTFSFWWQSFSLWVWESQASCHSNTKAFRHLFVCSIPLLVYGVVCGASWKVGAMQRGFGCSQRLTNALWSGPLILTINLECGFPDCPWAQKNIQLKEVEYWSLPWALYIKGDFLVWNPKTVAPRHHQEFRSGVSSYDRQLCRVRSQSSGKKYVRKKNTFLCVETCPSANLLTSF